MNADRIKSVRGQIHFSVQFFMGAVSLIGVCYTASMITGSVMGNYAGMMTSYNGGRADAGSPASVPEGVPFNGLGPVDIVGAGSGTGLLPSRINVLSIPDCSAESTVQAEADALRNEAGLIKSGLSQPFSGTIYDAEAIARAYANIQPEYTATANAIVADSRTAGELEAIRNRYDKDGGCYECSWSNKNCSPSKPPCDCAWDCICWRGRQARISAICAGRGIVSLPAAPNGGTNSFEINGHPWSADQPGCGNTSSDAQCSTALELLAEDIQDQAMVYEGLSINDYSGAVLGQIEPYWGKISDAGVRESEAAGECVQEAAPTGGGNI